MAHAISVSSVLHCLYTKALLEIYMFLEGENYQLTYWFLFSIFCLFCFFFETAFSYSIILSRAANLSICTDCSIKLRCCRKIYF